MDNWKSLVYSSSERIFEQEWPHMQDIYGQSHQAILVIRNTWIIYEEKFVSAWVDRVLHLGSKNTSRVEEPNAAFPIYTRNLD
jgi:hypothetical protein